MGQPQVWFEMAFSPRGSHVDTTPVLSVVQKVSLLGTAFGTAGTLEKSVLASTSNVYEFYPDAQNNAGRMEEIRKRAFFHLK